MFFVFFYKLKSLVKLAFFFVWPGKSIDACLTYNFTDERLKFTHLLECVNYLRVAEIPNVYFEFGCHSGRTFSAVLNAARFFSMANFRAIAFDSFMGLPDTSPLEDGVFRGGEFSTSRSRFKSIVKFRTGSNLADKQIVEGFYEESLTAALQAELPKVGMVHIDVDLYSSTISVLEFVKPLLVEGSVILFDDWYCFSPGSNRGERKAFLEFCANNPDFKFEEWKAYSTFGKSFFVVQTA